MGDDENVALTWRYYAAAAAKRLRSAWRAARMPAVSAAAAGGDRDIAMTSSTTNEKL
jgi:hypothetical protein